MDGGCAFVEWVIFRGIGLHLGTCCDFLGTSGADFTVLV